MPKSRTRTPLPSIRYIGRIGRSYIRTPEYISWTCMKARCLRASDPSFTYYGGRGIKIDPRWLDFGSFLQDMGKCPAGMTLERLDTDGHYTLNNCCWATPKEQATNRRNNRPITANGKTQLIQEWADELKMPPGVLWTRLRLGWTHEEMILTPYQPYQST